MNEWVSSFTSFAHAAINGSAIMPAEGMGTVYYYGIASTVILILAIRIATKKNDGPLRGFFARAFKSGDKGEYLAHSALKTCPKCALQLPLSTLVCDTCDFNFLSGCVGTRHKLLPAPDAARSTG